jgi:hypothetical protein
VKQLRTTASIEDHIDGNNRPNKRYRTIDSCDDDDDDENGDDYNDDEMVIGTECLCLSITISKTRRCSRCIEAILNEASIDRSHSEWSHHMMLPTVDGMKASILTADMREPLRRRGVE